MTTAIFEEMRQHGNIAGLGSAFRQMYALRKQK